MYETSAELRGKGFDLVHVEIDRYDGPWSGLADVHGAPHYFSRGNFDDCYFVWPVDDETLALEREWWRLYGAAWNARYEADTATPPTVPPVNEVDDARYSELEALLEPKRVVPPGARLLVAEWSFASDFEDRYRPEGADYLVRWSEPA